MKTALAALIVGYGLDLLLGDPSFLYHPIRVIGNLIALTGKMAAEGISENAKGRACRRSFSRDPRLSGGIRCSGTAALCGI